MLAWALSLVFLPIVSVPLYAAFGQRRFDGKVLALTAEVRLSALILGALPFVVSGALLAIKPTYLAPLLGSDGGREMLLVGVVSLLIGAVLMRRLAAVEG